MFIDRQTIRRVIVLVIATTMVVLVVAGCAPTNTAGQVTVEENAMESEQRRITVVGKGEAAGQPDEAHVTVGVDTFAKLVNEATNENESTIQAILAALTDEGIAAEDIQTSNYNLWAEQLYGEEGPEGIGGYRVSNQVNVTIRDIDKVGDVIAAAINAGANTIYGVNFSVADPDALEAEAREAAIADAQERAESLAALSGVTLGDIVDINEVLAQVPYPMMGLGGGGGDVAGESSIAPGQLSYYVQVQVTYAMK